MVNREKLEYGLFDTQIDKGKHVFSFLFELIIEDKIYNQQDNIVYNILKKIVLKLSDEELNDLFENNKLTHRHCKKFCVREKTML